MNAASAAAHRASVSTRMAWVSQARMKRLPGSPERGQNELTARSHGRIRRLPPPRRAPPAARRGASRVPRRGRRAGCGRRSRPRAPPRPRRRRAYGRAAGRAPRPRPTPRSGPSRRRSCRPARSSRRPGSPWRRCGRSSVGVGLPAERRWRGGSAAARRPSVPVRSGGVQPVEPGQQLGERADAGRDLRGAWVVGELDRVGAQRGQAGRLEADDRDAPARRTGASTSSVRADDPARRVQLAGADPGQAAAGGLRPPPRRAARPAPAPDRRPPGSGAKRSVNVSAQSTTSYGSVAVGDASYDVPRDQRRSGSGASVGRLRRWSTPAAAFATRCTAPQPHQPVGQRRARLASRAHRGSRPSA